MYAVSQRPSEPNGPPSRLAGLDHIPKAAERNNSYTMDRAIKRRKTSDEEPLETTDSDPSSVLFRHTAASTKKHTRPPMSKLFSSIELTPEKFLELQAAAKEYMLDDRFPERRDTVGIRGKGDSELVKLRLWNCVKDFLEREGYGEVFFSPRIPSGTGAARSMVWPQDRNRIITALTPLLRRVITNERQRQYALETRSKGHSEDKPSDTASDKSSHPAKCEWPETGFEVGVLFNDFTQKELFAYNDWKQWRNLPKMIDFCTDAGISQAGFDELVAIMHHHLHHHHSSEGSNTIACSKPCENAVVEGIVDSYPEVWDGGHWRCPDIDINPCDKSINVRLLLHEMFRYMKTLTGHATTAEIEAHSSIGGTPQPAGSHMPIHPCDPKLPCRSPLSLKVTVMEEGRDIVISKRELSAADTPYRHTLLQKICVGENGRVNKHSKLYFHLPNGLTLIENDQAWVDALAQARKTIWFDGQANVLVQVASSS